MIVMTHYSVKQLSKLAGVSVRTLHHYDRIGLLNPAFRSEKGYRFYKRAELLKLQQILFYKELDFSLKEIGDIINDPSFDLINALEFHKDQLLKRSKRLEKLLTTIEKTISELKNKNKVMKDNEIYKGFSEQEVKSMRNEVTHRWGKDKLLEAENRIRNMGEQGWEDTKQKGEEITQLLADLMDFSPSDIKVQEAIDLHHRFINQFFDVTIESYRGLGKLYVEDERFNSHYEKYRSNLASFIQAAINIYCGNDRKVNESN
jgi:DNA-binding transcriptional MerR regulator